MKFICDEMLASLGKWLRTAGYDTLIIDCKCKDADILQLALNENRFLLTRDRHFLEMQHAEKAVIFIKSNSIDEWVKELNSMIKINWLYHPFSRCLICNDILISPDKEIISKLAPATIHSLQTQFWYCAKCKKLYWEGSHTKRMLHQLNLWNQCF